MLRGGSNSSSLRREPCWGCKDQGLAEEEEAKYLLLDNRIITSKIIRDMLKRPVQFVLDEINPDVQLTTESFKGSILR